MQQTNERISSDTPLDTPALVARGFAEAVQELQESGSMTAPDVIAFAAAAVALVDAVSKSKATAEFPDRAIQVMNRIVISTTVASGLAQSAFNHG
jgi:hypothetical protein